MDFNVKLVNHRGWWLMLYLLGVVILVVWLIPLLNAYNAFLTAGVGVIILFGGGWLFWRIEIAIQQPVLISVLVNELVMINQQTGRMENWLFDGIISYHYFPQVRGAATLRLTLQSGDKLKLVARDAGLTSASTAQFNSMVREFEIAWHLYKAH